MKEDWKSTFIGAGLSAVTALTAIANYQELAPKHMLIIAGLAVAQFLFGMWAKDRA